MSYNSAMKKYEKNLIQRILDLKYPSSDKYVEHICKYVVNEKKNALDVCRMFRLYDILRQRNRLTIDFRNVPFDEARKIIEKEFSDYFLNY